MVRASGRLTEMCEVIEKFCGKIAKAFLIMIIMKIAMIMGITPFSNFPNLNLTSFFKKFIIVMLIFELSGCSFHIIIGKIITSKTGVNHDKFNNVLLGSKIENKFVIIIWIFCLFLQFFCVF